MSRSTANTVAGWACCSRSSSGLRSGIRPRSTLEAVSSRISTRQPGALAVNRAVVHVCLSDRTQRARRAGARRRHRRQRANPGRTWRSWCGAHRSICSPPTPSACGRNQRQCRHRQAHHAPHTRALFDAVLAKEVERAVRPARRFADSVRRRQPLGDQRGARHGVGDKILERLGILIRQ